MKKFKGLPAIIIALIFCGYMRYSKSIDRYSVQYSQGAFKTYYSDNYSGHSGDIQEYTTKKADSITYLVRGPINLKKSDYSVDLQYAAGNDSTVFKIFAADYVCEDNAPGLEFVHAELTVENSSYSSSFTLDQDVDSLFVVFETTDSNLQIGRINVRSENYVFNDIEFYIILTVVFTILILWLLNGRFTFVKNAIFNGTEVSSKKTVQVFFFVIISTIFLASLPLFQEGLILGHDTYFHMGRMQGLARGLQSGQFPVRIHGGTLNNYGYPNSIFYGELMMYAPALLIIMGVSPLIAFKFYLVMVNAITAIVSYVSFKKLTNSRLIGLTLSVLYTLYPYRLLCMHYRSAIGEYSAITFIPLVLYGLYAIIFGEKEDWPYLVLGATGIIQSHFLSTELTVLFAVLFVVYGVRPLLSDTKRIISLIRATVGTLLLNLWYIVPMFLMMFQLGLKAFQDSNYPSGFSEYNLGYIFTVATLHNQGLNSVGWVTLIAVRAFILYAILYHDSDEASLFEKQLFKAGYLFLWLVVGCAFASTAFFPWSMIEKITPLRVLFCSVQFPFRYYTISSACSVALTGISIILWSRQSKSRTLLCILSVAIIVVNAMLFYEFNFYKYDVEKIPNKVYYTNNMDNQHVIGLGEYLVEGSIMDDMVGYAPVIESTNENLQFSNLKRYGTNTSFSYKVDNLGEDEYIILPISYIPNYIITVDGVRVPAEKIIKGGRVGFKLTQASGDVTVKYREPKTFRACEMVTVMYILSIVFRKRILEILQKYKLKKI